MKDHTDWRKRPALLWLLLTIASGVVLAAAFFVPANTTQLQGISPAQKWDWYLPILRGVSTPDIPMTAIGRAWTCSEMVAACICPYLIGASLALRSGVTLFRREDWTHRISTLLSAILMLVVISILIHWTVQLFVVVQGTGDFIVRLRPYTWWFWAFAAIVLLIYLVRSWRFAEQRYYYHAFAAMTMMTIWFAANLSCPQTSVGTSLSLVACVVLLLATISGFRHTKFLTWRRAFRFLTLCRLPSAGVTCPKCEYNLFGLAEQRCPECGRPFTFEELGATPEELGFARVTPRP